MPNNQGFIKNHQPEKKLHSRHSILGEAKEWIAELEKDERVLSIHPGRIYDKKSTVRRGPKYMCETISGKKYHFHAGKKMQEFFICFKGNK